MNGTCIFPDNDYCVGLQAVRRAIGAISVLSSVFILFLIFLFRRYEFTSQRLILYLVTATLFDALSYVLGGIVLEESALCTLDGLFLHLVDWGVVVWVCNITVNLFWNVVVLRPTNRYFEVFYISAGIAVPVLFGVIPFIDSSYGPAGLWCWIVDDEVGQILRFLTWYVPVWIIIPGLFVAFLVIITKLSWELRKWDPYNPSADRYRDLIRREIKPLIMYPFVFLLLNVFPSINRIQNAFAPNGPIFALYFLHSVSSSLLGAGCTLIFVVNRDTLRELKYSNFKQTLLTRFKSRGEVLEYDAKEKSAVKEHSMDISPREEVGYREYLPK